MIKFAIGRYGTDDWRLVKWDGANEREIGSFSSEPTLQECCDTLMEYHGTGSSPFSSREGSLDSLDLTNQWPIPRRDLTLPNETMPWNDTT